MNKDKIQSAIVSEIQEHQSKITEHQDEVNRLKKVLKIYKYSVVDTDIVDESQLKRKYVKSGKYAKKKSSVPKKRKKLTGNLKRINWKELITDTLKANGEPMTSKELVAELFSGKHKSTLKVLKRRISVVLTLYKNDGTLQTDKNGRGLKYGLPYMF